MKINADYTSLIVPRADGGVAKDDRLANYSPTFKQQLLVEALGYIRRFAGTRCVVKYGGAAMVKESLKKSFCDDIGLLRSVGLRPIVVHGGGPEITRTLEKLGVTPEFVDGQRVTNTSDLKVVEMVLTGSINTDLVTLLNREGGHAVGVSGKDGALLRARKLIPENGGRDLGQVGEITRVNKDFLDLLVKCLNTWTSTQGRIYHNHGIPQGPLSSGLLSEVVLQHFDQNRRTPLDRSVVTRAEVKIGEVQDARWHRRGRL